MTWVDELRAHEAVYRRAPSAHNTQPWTLDYRADEIVIGVAAPRALPDSDPTGRDLLLGLGAFTETCLIVAASAGLPVTCDLSDPTRIRLVPGPYGTPFTTADVQRRRVARGPYAPGIVDLDPPGDPAGLDLADPDPADLDPVRLEPGLAQVPSRVLADDLVVADRWMFATPRVALELRSWLRLDPRDPDYHRDGLTDRALEMSRAEAVFLSAALRAYGVTRRLGLPGLLAASGRSLLRYDGSVLVLTDDGRDTRESGRRLLRTWLALGRRGLAVHPLSQLIDCPVTAARLAARVGATPLAVFRVGRPLREPVRSARLP